MNWNELKKNPLLWVAGVVAVLFALSLGKDFVVQQVANEVIHKMQSEYTPGPYSPGFDPDKVDPNHWRQAPPVKAVQVESPTDWQLGWEATRR